MRATLEGGTQDGMFVGRRRFQAVKQTLGGTLTLTALSPSLHFLDPGGSGRTVLLPPEADSEGLSFVIVNTGDNSDALTVKEDSNSTTIGAIGNGDAAEFYCDGTAWYADSVDTASITNLTVETLAVTTTATMANAGLRLLDTGGDHYTTVKQNSNEAAARVANIPALGADDTFDMIGQAQSVTGLKTFTKGAKASTAVTATADGLTTGVIAAGALFVVVTSDSADKIVTLPAGVAGYEVMMWVGATGCEVRTPAAGSATINGVDCDGTNELAIVATTLVHFKCVATDTWIAYGWSELGAAIATLLADAS